MDIEYIGPDQRAENEEARALEETLAAADEAHLARDAAFVAQIRIVDDTGGDPVSVDLWTSKVISEICRIGWQVTTVISLAQADPTDPTTAAVVFAWAPRRQR